MKIKSVPAQTFGKGWIFNVKYSPDGKQVAVATTTGIYF